MTTTRRGIYSRYSSSTNESTDFRREETVGGRKDEIDRNCNRVHHQTLYVTANGWGIGIIIVEVDGLALLVVFCLTQSSPSDREQNK